MKNKQLDQIMNMMIVETIFSDPRLIKNADDESNVTSKVSNYFKEKLSNVENSDDKLAVITEFMVPGIIGMIGGPIAVIIYKILNGVFHFNIGEMFSHMVSSLKRELSGGKKITSEQAHDIAASAVAANMPPDPDESTLERMKAIKATAGLNFRESQLLKLAVSDYIDKNPNPDLSERINIKFAAGLIGSALENLFSIKSFGLKTIVSILGWILDAALMAGGFMIAGDVAEHYMNKGNSGSGAGKAPVQEETAPARVSTQTLWKPSSSYTTENNNSSSDEWMIPGNPSNIGATLIQWAKEIYPGVSDGQISTTASFHDVVDYIQKYNKGGNSNLTIIPHAWKSRKQIVDLFIDDAATRAGSVPASATTTSPIAPHSNLKPATIL